MLVRVVIVTKFNGSDHCCDHIQYCICDGVCCYSCDCYHCFWNNFHDYTNTVVWCVCVHVVDDVVMLILDIVVIGVITFSASI